MTDKKDIESPSQLRPFDPDPKQSQLKLIAFIGFFILLLGVLIVTLVLPAKLEEKKNHTQAISENMSAKQNQVDSAQAQLKAQEAQEILDAILQRQARLENDGIKIWGEEKLMTSYPEVLDLLNGADLSFKDSLYDEALKGYREVLEKLKQLEQSRLERAQQAIKKGEKAFEDLDGEGAVHHFNIALTADPNQPDVPHQLKRAQNLPQILDLIAQGEQSEKESDLMLAQSKYREAILLDKEFILAQEHFQRLSTFILDIEFSGFMSQAELALKQNDIQQAKAAFRKAQQLKPTAPEIRDLGAQLYNVALSEDFQKLGQKALQHEMDEDWPMAAVLYEDILKMDANAVFAQEGKKRVGEILAIVQKIQEYLTHSSDLREPEHSKHASEIYELAISQKDVGPKFYAQAEQLKLLITEYNQPIAVLIQSDHLTDVTVYRVGKLGVFDEHRLELLPGQYKAVGHRSGYRDVIVPFTVSVGLKEVIIRVSCKETI